jgi:hypothetical protein
MGGAEVKILQKYITAYPVADRKGRFFRKLLMHKSIIVGSNQKIGKNVAANYPRIVAVKLGLPNPEKYTSHALKRTGITFLADAGNIHIILFICTLMI